MQNILGILTKFCSSSYKAPGYARITMKNVNRSVLTGIPVRLLLTTYFITTNLFYTNQNYKYRYLEKCLKNKFASNMRFTKNGMKYNGRKKNLGKNKLTYQKNKITYK